jgi:hypothetical protein
MKVQSAGQLNLLLAVAGVIFQLLMVFQDTIAVADNLALNGVMLSTLLIALQEDGSTAVINYMTARWSVLLTIF